MSFKIGDKVTFKVNKKDEHLVKQIGTVLEIQEGIDHEEKKYRYIRVHWEQDYDWSHDQRELELVEEPSNILKDIL